MPTPTELESKFWSKLRSDQTVMFGLSRAEHGHYRPLTAQLDDDQGNHGPIWFFTAKDTELGQALAGGPQAASATFSSRSHELFACMHGEARIDNNRAVIDRLWNPFVAAWFEGGKDDPKLALVRFDAGKAEVWENASSLVAGIKMLLGMKPQEEYKDQKATVRLDD